MIILNNLGFVDNGVMINYLIIYQSSYSILIYCRHANLSSFLLYGIKYFRVLSSQKVDSPTNIQPAKNFTTL